MFHENYEEIIDKFERVLHKITTETTRGVIFEHLPPMSMLRKEILKYGYASVKPSIVEKKELETEESQEKQLSFSKFPR